MSVLLSRHGPLEFETSRMRLELKNQEEANHHDQTTLRGVGADKSFVCCLDFLQCNLTVCQTLGQIMYFSSFGVTFCCPVCMSEY